MWTIPVGFIENALFGPAQMQLGITNEVVDQVVRTSIMWGIPALSVAVGFYLYYQVTEHFRLSVPIGHAAKPTADASDLEQALVGLRDDAPI